MDDIFSEAVNEVIGRSKKRWGLPLVGFVAGVFLAFWLGTRGRGDVATDDSVPLGVPAPAAPMDPG